MTIYKISEDNPSTVFIILDASVKNDITISIIYIQRKQALITKAIYHTINITSTEAELFTIRYEIS